VFTLKFKQSYLSQLITLLKMYLYCRRWSASEITSESHGILWIKAS